MANNQNPPGGAHQPGTPKSERMPTEQGKEAGSHGGVRTTAAGHTGKATVRFSSSVVTSKAPVDGQSPYLPPA